MDYSPPGFFVHGISQARIQKWVAISFSSGIFLTQGSNLSPAMQVDYVPLSHQGNPLGLSAAAAAKLLQSCPTLCDPIDGAHQAPPSLGFSRQDHWSGLPFPSPMQESEK